MLKNRLEKVIDNITKEHIFEIYGKLMSGIIYVVKTNFN